jgi:hypothetical protein
MFGKYSFALTNPRESPLAPLERLRYIHRLDFVSRSESPLAPLKKGGTGVLVPLEKGDLGGFIT